MSKLPIIGLDVDGVVANFAQVVVSIYNYKSICEGSPPFINNDVCTVNDFVRYDIVDVLGKECFFEVTKIMELKKACMRFPLYKNSKKVYSELCNLGEIVFITKPFSLYKDWYSERNHWLKKNFGVESEQVVYTAKKHLVNVDILIDDSPEILDMWAEHTKKPAIKVERPWNKDYNRENIICAKDIKDLPKLVTKALS